MLRSALFCICALPSLAFSQTSPSNFSPASNSPVQVLYAADATNLYTYDISPKSFQPSLVGTAPLPKTQVIGLAASSDGKFLYVMASDPYPATDNSIFVYDTNADGVPGTLLQSVPATNAYSMFVDPTGQFLYGVYMGTHVTQNLTLPFTIFRYAINSTNGELTQRVNEVTELLPDQDTENCYLSVVAMNANGTDLYDDEFCGTHEGINGFYHQWTVNPQTGALSAQQQIYSYSVDTIGGPASVQFVNGLMFAFYYPISYEPYNELQVYSTANGKSTTPLINCTSTMLAACSSDTGVASPSGKYVFYISDQITNDQSTVEVDSVDLSSDQIVPTGTTFSTLAPNLLEFSPDGSVVYSRFFGAGTDTISIFGFNAANASITTGGTLTDSSFVAFLPAERY